MTNLEKKNYIKKVWKTSSGSKITEMFGCYWNVPQKTATIEEKAIEIFNINQN